MNILKRELDYQIINHFQKYKEILILLGARQVGKTTLLKRLFPQAFYLTVDNEPVKKSLESYDINIYRQIIPDNINTVIIDEIHLLNNPGRAAKIFYDQIPNLHLIITGSSSLNIKNKTSESLAGRKIDYFLYPLTFSEYLYQKGIIDKENHFIFDNLTSTSTIIAKKAYLFDLEISLTEKLIFGGYPNLINHPQDQEYLKNLIDSAVFKDIIELDLIENRSAALSLLKLLAYQIGQLVNYAEIAQRLSTDARTIKRYLDIFEQSFIIFRLYPYSKNKRIEIGKAPKIYFYDTGLRNALIGNFSDINERSDRGSLFENFIIADFLKTNSYQKADYKINYWRSKQGSEIDLVLEKNRLLLGNEIKFSPARPNRAFANRYPQALVKIVSSKNFY